MHKRLSKFPKLIRFWKISNQTLCCIKLFFSNPKYFGPGMVSGIHGAKENIWGGQTGHFSIVTWRKTNARNLKGQTKYVYINQQNIKNLFSSFVIKKYHYLTQWKFYFLSNNILMQKYQLSNKTENSDNINCTWLTVLKFHLGCSQW